MYIIEDLRAAFVWCWRHLPVSFRKWAYHRIPRDVIVNGRRRVSASQETGSNVAPKKTTKTSGTPTLSIILPAYNVEEYVLECLASLANQAFDDFEVIVVDDGSTDSTRAIIADFVKSDPRFRLHSKGNAGLGAARNTGLSLARGRYIAFCDSDDYVVGSGYGGLVEMLEASGSDFASGSIYRLENSKKWIPKWAKRAHAATLSGIAIEENVDMLWDVTAWNKVFRREFFGREIGDFPEGILYEDQEVTAAAFLRARSFDVHANPMYVWRIRENGTSITQRKHELKNLRDRLSAADSVAKMMQSASAGVQDAWWTKTLSADLDQFVEEVPRTDGEYWGILSSGMRALVGLAPSTIWDNLPHKKRTVIERVVFGTRADVVQLLVDASNGLAGQRIKADASGLVFESLLPQSSPSLLTQSINQVRPVDLQPHAVLDGWDLLPNGSVRIRGHAYVNGLDSTEHRYHLGASLKSADTGQSRELALARRADPSIDDLASDPNCSYSQTGFEILLEASDYQQLPPGKYMVDVKIAVSGLLFVFPFGARNYTGSAGLLEMPALTSGKRPVFLFDKNDGLTVDVNSPRVLIRAIEQTGLEVAISFTTPDKVIATQLVIARPDGSDLRLGTVTRGADDSYLGTFLLPEQHIDAPISKLQEWRIRIKDTFDRLHYLNWAGSSREFEELEISRGASRLDITAYGYLRVLARRWQVEITDVTFDEESCEVSVSGTSLVSGARQTRTVVPHLVLESGVRKLAGKLASLDLDRRSFTYVFSLSVDDWAAGSALVANGTYVVRIDEAGSSDLGAAYWPSLSAALARELPREYVLGLGRLEFSRTPTAAALSIRVAGAFSPEHRSKRSQRLLSTQAFQTSSRGLRNSAFFESFGGRSTGDSPRALFELARQRDPGKTLYWSVRDASVMPPEGAVPLLAFSQEWYEALSTSTVLVNNNNFPHYFRKAQGQTYIQTWHGTPLKRIGKDVPAGSLSLGYRDLMQRESEYWDVLLAQGPVAATTLRSAFGFSGETLALGYPRNDDLVNGRSHYRADRLRKHLGIQESDRVLLYAPTWRDNRKNLKGQYESTLYLDMAKLQRLVGDGWTILYRGHVNTIDSVGARGGSKVIDVSRYPDVNDLYALADVLVTDYSSVMFDWAVLGKPILFLVPDLDEYETSVRGFYHDFRSLAPGPLVKTTDEIAGFLLDLESIDAAYRERYSSFVGMFAPLDDGSSAERVFRQVWK